MKRFFQISGMALLIMLFADLRNPASAQPDGDVSYQNFYDELSPYGHWIDYPEYGYVWAPDQGPDFRPYSTNGRWVWSDDYEWMWVSDYSWGWAPFHYGRWFYDDLDGWLWMPGYDWSPAWVAWRGGGDYYGWAPLRPGINISVGFSIGSYAPPVNYWCFAPSRYITSPRIYDYCVSSRQNVTIINNTTIINNYNYQRNVFVTGPRRNEVERYTNQRIHPVRVREISAPGRTGFRHNEVAVYRPGIRRDNNRDFAPRQFDNYRRGNENRVADRNYERANPGRFDNRTSDRTGARDFNRRDNTPVRDNRFGRDNNNPQQPASRPFEQRRADNNVERNVPERNDRINPADNNNRHRSAREVFGQDNRRGIDDPVRRNNFERNNQPAVNENRNRDENNFNRRFENNNRTPREERRDVFNNRDAQQQRPSVAPREERRDVFNNRDAQQQRPSVAPREERRDVFNNRNAQAQQQQRPSFPSATQQQPRSFEPPAQNRGGNADRGGGFRRH